MWFEYSAGTRNHLFKDERGSVIAADNGSSVAKKQYDEYGNAAGDYTGRFQYTGQTWMPELGLYYYKARAYNPDLGRFMQTDPIGTQDQMNLYAYVGNDPLNMNDPSGMETVCAKPIDSLIPRCFDVDADLTRAQIANLRNAYSEAITRWGTAGKGRDVSDRGLPVTDLTGNAQRANFVSAASQIVGFANGGWAKGIVGIAIASVQQLKSLGLPGGERGTALGNLAAVDENGRIVSTGLTAQIFLNGDETYNKGYFSKAGNVARVLIHENRHGLYKRLGEHQVDAGALDRMRSQGLDGTGCDAIMGRHFWIIPRTIHGRC